MEKKSAQIVCLTENHLPIGHTPEVVVNLLAKLLNKAETGELRGIAVSWIEGNGDVCNQIAEGSAGSALLVAAVTALFYEINSRWMAK